MRYIATVEDKQFLIEIIDDKHVSVDGKVFEVDFESVIGQPVYSLIVDGKSHEGYVAQSDDHWQVLLRGRLYPIVVEDEREKRLRSAASSNVAETGEFLLRAPMPGLIVAILVEEGQPVKKGQVLLILESMKMQNELKAPRDGTVGRVRVKASETVEQRQILLSIL
jgi:biotin carboxyl carrier protein